MNAKIKLAIAGLASIASSILAFYIVNALSSGIMIFSAILVTVFFTGIATWMFVKLIKLEDKNGINIAAKWSCLHCILMIAVLMFLLPVFGAKNNTALLLWRMDIFVDRETLYLEDLKQRLYIGMSEEESVKILGHADDDYVYQETKPRGRLIRRLEEETGKKLENNSKINMYYTNKILLHADGIALIFTNGKLKHIIDRVGLEY